MAKTKKINADELKAGQFFRRGRKKAVWQRDNDCLCLTCQQITDRNAGEIDELLDEEQITPVKVKITVTS